MDKSAYMGAPGSGNSTTGGTGGYNREEYAWGSGSGGGSSNSGSSGSSSGSSTPGVTKPRTDQSCYLG